MHIHRNELQTSLAGFVAACLGKLTVSKLSYFWAFDFRPSSFLAESVFARISPFLLFVVRAKSQTLAAVAARGLQKVSSLLYFFLLLLLFCC